jgi:hypothetical protein
MHGTSANASFGLEYSAVAARAIVGGGKFRSAHPIRFRGQNGLRQHGHSPSCPLIKDKNAVGCGSVDEHWNDSTFDFESLFDLTSNPVDLAVDPTAAVFVLCLSTLRIETGAASSFLLNSAWRAHQPVPFNQLAQVSVKTIPRHRRVKPERVLKQK